MTPAARLQAVIELLDTLEDALKTGGGADIVPAVYFRKRRYAGAKDRRAVTERFFSILRRRARLDWWIERVAANVPTGPRAYVIADLALADNLDADDIAALFGSTPYAPAPLASDERDLARALEGQTLDHPTMPDRVRRECPAWLEAPLRAAFGDAWAAEMDALNQAAPVDLRVNRAKTDRAALQAILNESDIAAAPTPLSPVGLRLSGNPRATRTKAYRAGLFAVQDEGSQLAALLVDAQPGMTVVDYCAGAGGKTLALADAMTAQGRFEGTLWACDVSGARLDELAKRAHRAGIEDAIAIHCLQNGDGWRDDNAGCAERVLLDVPCSGSGAWRREPENKWRLTPQILEGRLARQQEILSAAADLVKPGGRLVYVTCSLLGAENEDRIARFTENRSDFTPCDAHAVWSHVIGAGTDIPPPGPFIRLTPASTGTDGFFVAILERAG